MRRLKIAFYNLLLTFGLPKWINERITYQRDSQEFEILLDSGASTQEIEKWILNKDAETPPV